MSRLETVLEIILLNVKGVFMLRYTKALSLALLVSLPCLAMEKEKQKQAEVAAQPEKKEVVFWNKEPYRCGPEIFAGKGTKEEPYKSVFAKAESSELIDGKYTTYEPEKVIVEKEVSGWLRKAKKTYEVKKQERDPQYAQEFKELTWQKDGEKECRHPAFYGVRTYSSRVKFNAWKATEGKEKSMPVAKNELLSLTSSVIAKTYSEEQTKLEKLKKEEAAQTAKTEIYRKEIERRKLALQIASGVREVYDANEKIRLEDNKKAKEKDMDELGLSLRKLDQLINGKQEESKK